MKSIVDIDKIMMEAEARIPQPGQERVCKRFLWFPTSARNSDNMLETRWLEWAIVREKTSPIIQFMDMGPYGGRDCIVGYEWKVIGWEGIVQDGE